MHGQCNYIRLCKLLQNRKRSSFYTFWPQKNININGCKIVHLCTIAIVIMHICTTIVAFAYNTLVFFFSLLLFFSLSPLTLTSLFRFLQQIRTAKHTLSSLFLSSHSSSFHNCRSPPISCCHYHRLPPPPIADLSTDLIAFLYFWLFDQWVSG